MLYRFVLSTELGREGTTRPWSAHIPRATQQNPPPSQFLIPSKTYSVGAEFLRFLGNARNVPKSGTPNKWQCRSGMLSVSSVAYNKREAVSLVQSRIMLSQNRQLLS